MTLSTKGRCSPPHARSANQPLHTAGSEEPVVARWGHKDPDPQRRFASHWPFRSRALRSLIGWHRPHQLTHNATLSRCAADTCQMSSSLNGLSAPSETWSLLCKDGAGKARVSLYTPREEPRESQSELGAPCFRHLHYYCRNAVPLRPRRRIENLGFNFSASHLDQPPIPIRPRNPGRDPGKPARVKV